MAITVEQRSDSGLTDTQRLALELADHYLIDPAGLDDATRDRAAALMSPAQLVDLAFLLLKARAFSKVTMALGLEPTGMETTVLGFDGLGWETE